MSARGVWGRVLFNLVECFNAEPLRSKMRSQTDSELENNKDKVPGRRRRGRRRRSTGNRALGRARWRLGLAASSPWEPRASAKRAAPRRSGAPGLFREKQWSKSSSRWEHPVSWERVPSQVTESNKNRETLKCNRHRTSLAGNGYPAFSVASGGQRPVPGTPLGGEACSKDMLFLPPRETPPTSTRDPRMKFLCKLTRPHPSELWDPKRSGGPALRTGARGIPTHNARAVLKSVPGWGCREQLGPPAHSHIGLLLFFLRQYLILPKALTCSTLSVR